LRASGVPSTQAERPTSSHANPTQATPPLAGGASLPPQDYKELYPWAIPTLLKETSSINTELGVLRLKKGDQPDLSFHKEHDSKVTVLPCLPGEPICADDKGNNDELFCFIYATLFKKVKLRFPFTRFERELLTELNIAPAQLHPNSWAFVRAFQILCAHLVLPASVDVFLFLFEAKNPGDRPWVSLNGIAGRSILSIFQQPYKDWKGKFVKVCQNDQDPSLLDGFPLYWVNKGNKDSKDSFRRPRSSNNMGELDKDLCLFWKSVAAPKLCPTRWWRSPLPKARLLPEVQLLLGYYPPQKGKN